MRSRFARSTIPEEKNGGLLVVYVLLCIRGKIKSTSPRGAYIWRGDLTEGFLRYDFGGLIFGGAYFRNVTVFAYWSMR